MRMQRAALAAAVILLPGVMLAPAWRLAGLGASEDDILYYYPSRVFLHETVAAGYWPWINPWNGADRPYAADPQSALWYPFTWLFAVLPPLWAYALCLWAHYVIAMWGMYRLLRTGSLGRTAAIFGGLVFAFSGFMLAHRAHFTMQQAAAWTPWMFWALQRYVHAPRQPAGKLMRRLAAVCGVASLQCLAGHVQIAAITVLGSLVYVLAERRTIRDDPEDRRTGSMSSIVVRWLTVWICVAGLFAVQWLPTLAYTRLCTRSERTYLQFTENSWNPASAVGWVLPMFFGQRTPNVFDQPYWGPSHQCEQFAYVGLTALILAALGMQAGWRADPQRRPWIVLLIFSLLLALGLFGPICPILYWIPGSSLFRVPARALLLADLAAATLAAITLNDLMSAPTPARARLRARALRWTRHPLLGGVLFVAIPLVLAALALLVLPAKLRAAAIVALRPWNPAIVVPLIVALATLAVLGFVVRRWRTPRWLWLLAALAAIDQGTIGWTLDVPAYARNGIALLSDPSADWLDAVRDSNERLWVVTDTDGVYHDGIRKRAANTNSLVHVRALTDYGPLQPIAFERQFRFLPWGISDDAAVLLHDTSWMRAFNVGWVLLCEPHWPAPLGCDPVPDAPAEYRLVHNPTAAGMAFFDDPAQPGAVRYTERGPSAFATVADTWPQRDSSTSGPSAGGRADSPRIVVSRLSLPGWRATVNGQACPIETTPDALLAARVPRGRATTIEWTYFPPGLREGAAISLLSASGLGLLAILARTRTRANAVPPDSA